MSRIGRMPIEVPSAVKVELRGHQIFVEGPKGKLDYAFPKRTSVTFEDNVISVKRDGDDSEARALHGLARALINNMVTGVNHGFSKDLEIHGVGFKALVQEDVITLNLGYSHPIKYKIPAQVKVTVADNTKVKVESPDKRLVGKVAAEIRSYYPPEPYKGKGVRYSDEKVVRKEGKTVQ